MIVMASVMMVAIFFILAALKVGVSVERTFFQREPKIQIEIVKLLKLKLLTLRFDEKKKLCVFQHAPEVNSNAIFLILAALKVEVCVEWTFFQWQPEIQIKIVTYRT